MVLIIRNASTEFTVSKKVSVNAVQNGNENIIQHVREAVAERRLVSISDETNSSFVAVSSEMS